MPISFQYDNKPVGNWHFSKLKIHCVVMFSPVDIRVVAGEQNRTGVDSGEQMKHVSTITVVSVTLPIGIPS